VTPFVKKIVNNKTEKEKKTVVHGMIEMLAQIARPVLGCGGPGAGRDQGLPDSDVVVHVE
jgi:hypothetical protein